MKYKIIETKSGNFKVLVKVYGFFWIPMYKFVKAHPLIVEKMSCYTAKEYNSLKSAKDGLSSFIKAYVAAKKAKRRVVERGTVEDEAFLEKL